MRNLAAREDHPSGELHRIAGRDLADGERKPRGTEPVTIRGGQSLDQGSGADRPNDLDRKAARRQKAVLPGEYERGQVAVVVDVKMRDRHVRDRLPWQAVFGQPPSDAGPAVEQQSYLAGLQQIPGAASRG